MFFTYVLLSLKDREGYVSYTADLKKRLEEHSKGLNFSTKYRRPLKLIYYKVCLDERDAKQREKYLKTTAGRRFLAKRLKYYLFY
jgi:putative endonuclease